MHSSILLSFLCFALKVSAVPTSLLTSRSDSNSTANFVNLDGSIDISNLAAAAAINPTVVAPAQATNAVVNVDTAAVGKQAVNQASTLANAADDTPLGRRSTSLARRGVSPTWQGYEVCGKQTLFSTQKTDAGAADTPEAFKGDVGLGQIANTAATPKGYSKSYSNLNGVYQNPTANSYLGIQTLKSYDPQYCSDYCDLKIKGCAGFNIYFERDPSINIDANTDLTKCNNPPSAVVVACQFFGSGLNAKYATSTGQVRGNYFRTAKAGSNGYSKVNIVPVNLPGWKSPQTFEGGKIDNQKVAGFIEGVMLLTVNPDFDPQYCADVATKNYGQTFQSFQTWLQYKDGAYVGQGCMILSKRGYTSADAHDAGQYGSKTATVDESKVWYSSQPVYYYEDASIPLVADQGCSNAGLQMQHYSVDSSIGSDDYTNFGDYYGVLDPVKSLTLKSNTLSRVPTVGGSTLSPNMYHEALMYTGHFMAPLEDDYTFEVKYVDDSFWVWTDDLAKSGWSKDNVESKTSWESLGLNGYSTPWKGVAPGPATGIYTKHFTSGYHAIRILYTQNSSTQRLDLQIKDSKGTVLVSSDSPSKNLITAPCYNSASAFL